jgi:hypothetical protein
MPDAPSVRVTSISRELLLQGVMTSSVNIAVDLSIKPPFNLSFAVNVQLTYHLTCNCVLPRWLTKTHTPNIYLTKCVSDSAPCFCVRDVAGLGLPFHCLTTTQLHYPWRAQHLKRFPQVTTLPEPRIHEIP